MRVDILTLFPDMLRGVFSESILRIAQERGHLRIFLHDIRDFTHDKHGKVDDKPFGGGAGMVLCCQPIVDAVEHVRGLAPDPGRLFFMGPEGERFTQPVARTLSKETRLLLVCGRYEGFDERIFDILRPEVLSIGDYVLSGGELAAAVIVDAVARLIPGVLGSPESLASESFGDAGGAGARLLDYPHYTQPAEFRGLEVPAILRSGDHQRVAAWRAEAARARTVRWRPDLLADREVLPGEPRGVNCRDV